MKLSNCVFAAAIAFAMGSGSAVAGEQTAPNTGTPQATIMSDAELDQIVAGGAATFETVSINRTNAWEKSGGNAKATWNKSQGQGKSLGASGAWFGISLNPSP